MSLGFSSAIEWRIMVFNNSPTSIAFRLIPESLHWMVTHEKHEGVSSYIQRSTKYNRRHIDLEICRSSTTPSLDTAEIPETPSTTTATTSKTKDSHKRSFIDVFKHKPLVFQLISHCFIMIVMNFTYWALSLYSTDLHPNKMIGYFLSGFVELPAAGAVFLLVYWGRKTVTSIALLAQAAAMFIACFFPGKLDTKGYDCEIKMGPNRSGPGP